MALKIRLARGGAKKRPFYRMVVADSRAARDGAFLEKLGYYNPFVEHGQDGRVVVKEDRLRYWVSVGAKPSERVAVLLSSLGLCDKPVIVPSPKKSAPKKKAQERMAAKAASVEG